MFDFVLKTAMALFYYTWSIEKLVIVWVAATIADMAATATAT